MSRMLWMIAGMVLAGIALFNWLTTPLEVDQVEQETFVAKEEDLHKSAVKKVSEKLHEKYIGVDVKTTPQKELVLQVVGNEKYFNSVKKDLESIAKNAIRNSELKDYAVVFERWEFTFDPHENMRKELLHLSSVLMEGLQKYGATAEIEYQKSIIIHTAIKGSDTRAHKQAIEIEKTVNKILYKEINSVSHIDAYETKILNTKGKVIN